MKNYIYLLFILVTLLGACATAPPTLYSWGNYEASSYNYLKNADPESLQALVNTYENIIDTQKGSRGTVPPGIYADFGFLMIQNGDSDRGMEYLNKEIELYPESKIFIERILKSVEK